METAGCFLLDHGRCANLRKERVGCGFPWLLRVNGDHEEAVLLDPKLFSSVVQRPVVLLKRGSGRQTSSRWLFSRKCDCLAHHLSQSPRGVLPGLTGALYSKNGDQAAEIGRATFSYDVRS
jgi:hypothetical protein